MAAGAPIVATTVGAIPDMLDNDAGILVPPHDTAALANAIRRILDDPMEAAGMGERAKRRAESEYAVDSVVARYLALWASHTASIRARRVEQR
jgi:glycosyltransferase involved in cell wall biosynthesis